MKCKKCLHVKTSKQLDTVMSYFACDFFLRAEYSCCMSPDLESSQVCCVQWRRSQELTSPAADAETGVLICLSEKRQFSVRTFGRCVACEKWDKFLPWWLQGETISHNQCSPSALPSGWMYSQAAASLLNPCDTKTGNIMSVNCLTFWSFSPLTHFISRQVKYTHWMSLELLSKMCGKR